VQDDGGREGGVDLDPSPKTLSVNVTSVNDEPVSRKDRTVTMLEDTAYVFCRRPILGSRTPNDSPRGRFAGVQSRASQKRWILEADGTPVTAGQLVAVADLVAGNADI